MPWWGEEIEIAGPYEVLAGDAFALQWVPNPWTPSQARDVPTIQMRPFDAVEGGVDKAGSPLLLAQGFREGCGWQPGKIALGGKDCEIGWDHEAHSVRDFRILVWAE